MKIEQFREILIQLWNKPEFLSILKTTLGPDWQKKSSVFAPDLDRQHLWMAAHELGLFESFPQVDRPHYPFLQSDDIGERTATLGLSDNYKYSRMILDTFELKPYWENERDLNIDADILIAWEIPDQDPESRFGEFKEHIGWNLEIRLLTPAQAITLVGELFLGQSPFGTVYVNPLPMLNGSNLKSLKHMAADLLMQLGDNGDGLDSGDGGLSNAPQTTCEQDAIDVIQKMDWTIISFSLPNVLGSNWIDQSLSILKKDAPELLEGFKGLLAKNRAR